MATPEHEVIARGVASACAGFDELVARVPEARRLEVWASLMSVVHAALSAEACCRAAGVPPGAGVKRVHLAISALRRLIENKNSCSWSEQGG